MDINIIHKINNYMGLNPLLDDGIKLYNNYISINYANIKKIDYISINNNIYVYIDGIKYIVRSINNNMILNII